MAAHIDAIAAELLVVPPASFVRERDARAARARDSDAAGIRALRKPTVAAWAMNLLSHDADFRDAVALSQALHEAQDDLDAAELARLGRQRRALVAALARRAVALAAECEVTVAASARDEIERTINAAIVDPRAATVVGAGRLVRTLDPGALDPETLRGAVAGSVPDAAEAPAPPDDLAERRARREAQRALRDAERGSKDAARAVSRLDSALATARERADLLHERAEELRRDLARVAADAEKADAAVEALDEQRRSAAEAATVADRTLARARKDAET